MIRSGKISFLLIASASIVFIGSCAIRVSSYKRAFDSTTDGESLQKVVERFGTPSIRELTTKPYLRYAMTGCKSPCAERLWWEHPILVDIEAWSVEFDSAGNVIHKVHWVSP